MASNAAEKLQDSTFVPISAAPKVERNIYQRINAVMRECRGVEKSGFNKHDQYNYAGHEAVTHAVRDLFAKHGIVQTVDIVDWKVMDQGTLAISVRVDWVCDDAPTSKISSTALAIQPSRKGNLNAQQVGQAYSYAIKNVFFKQLMLTGDPEPDSDDEPSEPVARRSDPPPSNDDAPVRDAATEFLSRFGSCQTEGDVKALNDEIKKSWATVKTVKGFSEQLVLARTKAYERCRARQPDEEG